MKMSTAPYYDQIADCDVLSAKEEKLYAARALLGDKSAEESLVTANIKYVIRVARQYMGNGVPVEDLINEGCIGLITAVKKYDPTRKFKFITYASWWVRQAILKALSDQVRTVRIPTNKVALLSKVRNAVDALEIKLERQPTSLEIEEVLGEDINLASVYQIKEYPISLDSYIDTEDGVRTVADSIPDKSQSPPDVLMKPEMFLEELALILKDYPQREKDVIYFYFGVGSGGVTLTLEQIGNMYGICRERVRQIKNTVLEELRNNPNVERLREFL